MSQEQNQDANYSLLTVDQRKFRFSDLVKALRTRGLKNKYQAIMAVYNNTRVARALARYSYQRGAITAGGITFMSIFSLAALVTVGWTLFAHLFAQNPQFQESVVDSINSSLPGILDDPTKGTKGIIDPQGIKIGTGNFITGVIALGVAIYSGSRIVQYVSDGIRAMFGLLNFPRGFINSFGRGLLGLALLTISVAATAVLSIVSEIAVSWAGSVFPALKNLHDSMAFDLVSTLVPFVVNIFAFALLVRFVAEVRVPKRSLILGSVFFALASAVLRILGTMVVGSGVKDPVIAAAATVGTLMLWINFLARIALQTSAWMADPPAVIGYVKASDVNAKHTPNYVTLSDPSTLDWPYNPISGDLIPAREEPKGSEATAGSSGEDIETTEISSPEPRG